MQNFSTLNRGGGQNEPPFGQSAGRRCGMILNPVISGGAEEKVYKITNQNTNYIFQEQATAGEIVISKNISATSNFHGVRTSDGGYIPYLTSDGTIIPQQSRAGSHANVYFVMPAQNVTIIP